MRPLAKVHTRKLLSVLQDTRSMSSLVTCQYHEQVRGDERWKGSDDELTIEPGVFGFGLVAVPVTVSELKAELALREHVPSRAENSARHRQRNREGRQRGRRDR